MEKWRRCKDGKDDNGNEKMEKWRSGEMEKIDRMGMEIAMGIAMAMTIRK
jgi:hypothetical protein